ncbi:MAG: phage major capsid protein [Pseudomonadota bacterium]
MSKMTLKALKSQVQELKGQGRALLDAAQNDGDRELTAEEDQRFTAIEAELEALDAQIAVAERDAERRLRMQGTSIPTTGRIEVGQDRRAADPRAGFQSLAEFASAVHGSHPQTPGGATDERLSSMYQSAAGSYREGGSNDGYMVPPEFRDRIWELIFAGDNLLSEVDAEPTNSNQVNDLTDETTPWGATGVTAYWRAEATKMTATRGNVSPRSVILHELYAFVRASDELLEDAPRLNNRLETKAAEAISWKIDSAIVEGSGVGQPLGYMASKALVTVGKETGQAADTIVAANVAKMYARMLPQGMARAHWRVNSDVLPQLMTMMLGDQPIWTPPRDGFTKAPGGFLFGRPIKMSEHCGTLGDVGDIQLIDPKGYYGLRKNTGVKFASSIHLYFDYGEQAFRWTVRLGGQPHLSKPVAPNKGTASKSHFVTLDERA